MFFVEDADTLLEDDRRDFAVLGEHFLGPPSVHDGDAFFFHFRDLVFGRGHFLSGLEAEHCDFAICHAKCRASHICRHIAAADHYDIAAKPHGIILIDTAKEIDACYHAFRGFAGHAGKSSALKADGNVEGLPEGRWQCRRP